ncbi:unnamed protein product [Phaedon cochleariae]|uniref:Spindle assembly abnormal protein 6 N-terminal domain-containing protein n=1 Tax=Phaedon cochleariae TaxID=80249 RepID=A0A9P0GMV2_PHACE|nr:unnamed protein product [Phaedon cochleariae]
MSDRKCLYNKNHHLHITHSNGFIEERNLNISINNLIDSLLIKIRDPTEFTFNYTEGINESEYETIRSKQNLDIDFIEFKTTLLDMLQLFQKKEMFLKCEISDDICSLIFYKKSKIKSIIYLSLDLHKTDQKEIFNELIDNLQRIQDSNDTLKKQLANVRKTVAEREKQIQQLTWLKNQLERQFSNELKKVEDFFIAKSRDLEELAQNRIRLTQQRIVKLVEDVNSVKSQTVLKFASNVRLSNTIESLRFEATENAKLMNQLKKENCVLQSVNANHEKNIADLRHILNERDTAVKGLSKRNEELRMDNEKATKVIAQNKANIEELSKDLVQANQMLVNFNSHYDSKIKQVEQLNEALRSKEEILNGQKLKHHKVVQDFDNYKALYNKEIQEKLKHELFLSNSKIEELEKAIRKANKMNTLLTEKVNNMTLNSKGT